MKRTIFDDQHDAFREVFRGFLHREVVPEFAKWEEQGYAPREFYRKLGELGVMGFDIPEEYGGAGGDELPLSDDHRRGSRAGRCLIG